MKNQLIGKKILVPETTNEEPVAPKPYQKPELIDLGDLRTLTLGPTIGLGESGNEGVLKAKP